MADENQTPKIESKPSNPAVATNKNPLSQSKKVLESESGHTPAGSKSSVSKTASSAGSALKSAGKSIEGVGKKITGQDQGKNGGGPAAVAGAIGGASGSSAKQIAAETGKRAISLAMDIPDIVVMLPIAVVLDFMGIIAAILSIIGIGFGLQYVISIGGNIVIGFWIIVRSFFRGVVQKAISSIENMTGAPSTAQQPKGGVGKKGIKAGLSIARWLGLGLIKMIPFVGDLVPSFTITVIYELLQEQI